jgi:type I restriction enzyme, S subunit
MKMTMRELNVQRMNELTMMIGRSSERPEGWGWCPLGRCCMVNPPKPVAGEIPKEGCVSFVPMAAVDADNGAITSPQTRNCGEVRNGFTAFRDGDVIVAKITPCMENGKAAICRGLVNGRGFGSTEFHVLRPTEAVLAEYVYYLVRQVSFRREAAENMTGSVGQKRVPAEYLANVELPLPPLAEQKRIVAKVEELLARVNAARARLAKAPALLKRFRQSVLAAACSGQLTADWREKHDARAVEEVLAESAKSVDVKAIRHLVRRGTEGLPEVQVPEIPATWVNRSVRQLIETGAILDFQDGNHGALYPRAADFGEKGVRFLTAAQVFDNRVLLDQAPFLKHEKAKLLRIGFVRPRDVLLTHNATVGRVAMLPDYEGELILGTSVTYYRTNPKLLLPEYLCFAMQGQFWQDQLRSVMEQTTRNQVSVTKQIEFLLLVPPVAEQAEIVRRVQALFTLADKIEARVQAATARVEKITQAILAKAFRGQLVPTEAALARAEGRPYEPASALLARIRAQLDGSVPDGQAPKPRRRRRQRIADSSNREKYHVSQL